MRASDFLIYSLGYLQYHCPPLLGRSYSHQFDSTAFLPSGICLAVIQCSARALMLIGVSQGEGIGQGRFPLLSQLKAQKTLSLCSSKQICSSLGILSFAPTPASISHHQAMCLTWGHLDIVLSLITPSLEFYLHELTGNQNL